MLIEPLLIFISAIVSLNTSSNTATNHTSANKTEVSKTSVYTAPVSAERKNSGWDGN